MKKRITEPSYPKDYHGVGFQWELGPLHCALCLQSGWDLGLGWDLGELCSWSCGLKSTSTRKVSNLGIVKTLAAWEDLEMK